MSVDGKYQLELQTTMGPVSIGLILQTQGNSLTGEISGHFGDQTFSGGSVNGNELVWSVKLQSPIGEMNLAVKATIDGDDIQGEVQLGTFRPSLFKGKRV